MNTHPYLRRFESLLQDLKDGDILGEGSQGVVIRSIDDGVVIKLPLHEEGAKILQQELKTHVEFYRFMLQSRRELPQTIGIPLPREKSTGNESVYTMETVD